MSGPRLLWQNYATLGGAAIGASSAYPTMPARRLRDQIRSNRWRSASGWTVVAGFNDGLDVEMDGSTYACLLAEGTYATGDEMAAAVQDALEEAFEYVAGTWSVTYDADDYVFTIAHDTTVFALLWSSGASAGFSCGRDLGFDVDADYEGFYLSHTGETAVYQSRHYLAFDFGSALGVKAAVIFDHNAGEDGAFTVQGAASAEDSLVDPTVSSALDSTGYLSTFRAHLFSAEQSYRYWSIVIDDVENTDGYSEIGLVYLGSWLEFDYRLGGMDRSPVDYSGVAYADQGAQYQDRRQSTRAWDISLVPQELSVADGFDEVFAEIRIGGNFFFIPEPDRSPLRVLYGFMPEAPKIAERDAGVDVWDIQFGFQEALG